MVWWFGGFLSFVLFVPSFFRFHSLPEQISDDDRSRASSHAALDG